MRLRSFPASYIGCRHIPKAEAESPHIWGHSEKDGDRTASKIEEDIASAFHTLFKSDVSLTFHIRVPVLPGHHASAWSDQVISRKIRHYAVFRTYRRDGTFRSRWAPATKTDEKCSLLGKRKWVWPVASTDIYPRRKASSSGSLSWWGNLRDYREENQVCFSRTDMTRRIQTHFRQLSNGHFSRDNQKPLTEINGALPIFEAKMTGNTRLVVSPSRDRGLPTIYPSQYHIDIIPDPDSSKVRTLLHKLLDYWLRYLLPPHQSETQGRHAVTFSWGILIDRRSHSDSGCSHTCRNL